MHTQSKLELIHSPPENAQNKNFRDRSHELHDHICSIFSSKNLLVSEEHLEITMLFITITIAVPAMLVFIQVFFRVY